MTADSGSGLGLDFLTRVVNVHWKKKGGAVFIAAGDSEMILRAEIKKEDIQAWRDQPEESKMPVFEVIPIPEDFHGESQFAGAIAGSYRKVNPKPLFVLAGNDQGRVPDTGASHTWGIVMYSHDGKEWTRAGKLETGDYPANHAGFQALVWDNKFYAWAFSDEYYFREGAGTVTDVNTYDVMLSSTDGVSFTEEGRELRYNSAPIGGVIPPVNRERPDSFEEHFKNPAKLPDGAFGYHEERDDEGKLTESFLAVPKQPTHYWLRYTNIQPGGFSYDDTYASKFVDITIVKDGETIKKSVQTPIYVNGVAYVDKILMVGGRLTDVFRAAIACSIDQGNTWDIVWQATENYMHEVWVIIAAPLEDIEETTA